MQNNLRVLLFSVTWGYLKDDYVSRCLIASLKIYMGKFRIHILYAR